MLISVTPPIGTGYMKLYRSMAAAKAYAKRVNGIIEVVKTSK